MSSYGYSSPSQPSSVPSTPSTPSAPTQQTIYTPPPTLLPTPTAAPVTLPAPKPTPVAEKEIQSVITGPFVIDGYYPVYTTSEDAVNNSPDPELVRENETTVGYHTHTLRGRVYYMPNGLEMNVTQFHGNYGNVVVPRSKPDSSLNTLKAKSFFIRENCMKLYLTTSLSFQMIKSFFDCSQRKPM